MIVGIGIDLVNIPRIKMLISRWGDKFTKRVYSHNEIAYSENRLKSEQHFAASFAVKESFYKAVGSSFDDKMKLLDIEVLRDSKGKPFINLYGKAKEIIQQEGISKIHTSISHDGDYSIAFVIVEK